MDLAFAFLVDFARTHADFISEDDNPFFTQELEDER
jgi:hypothetical protein